MEESSNLQQPNSQFIQSIQAGLRYWQKKTQKLGAEDVRWLDSRRQNFFRAIEFGLNQPETWNDTAVLLLQTFDFGETQGYWSEWIPIVEQALANAPEKESVVYGRLQNRLGQLYRLANRLPEAEVQHNAALALAKSLENQELLLITYTCLAEYSLSLKQVDQTRAYGQAALDLAQTLPDLERLEAFARRILGTIEEFMGNWAEAINQYQQAIELWRTLDNHTYLARTWLDLGNVYSGINEYTLGQQAYEEAQAILRPTNNVTDKAIVAQNLGVLYYRQEEWAKAEAALLEVDLIKLREQHEFNLLAKIYNNLGNIYLKMKRLENAAEQLNLAIEIFRQRENELELGNSLGTLASVYEADGEHTKALQFYEEAVMLLQKFPESQWAKKLLREFGAAFARLRVKN